MTAHSKVLQVLLIAALWACAGAQAQDERRAPKAKAKASAPDAGTPRGNAGTPGSVDGPSKSGPPEKEKRANTPPGKSRAGDGPLDGAIVDPAGVVTK